jgi:O-Antigen ligase
MITRLLTALILAVLAFDAGSFSLASRTTLAIAVWWTLGLAVLTGLLPQRRPDRLSLAVASLLLLFAAFSGLSAAWAPSAEEALTEANRALLYAGVFALLVGLATRVSAEHLSDGIGMGIAAVGLVALASRLFPELGARNDLASLLPEARTRLSYPLDYWNGLAILVALGLPLLLRIGLTAERRPWRVAALAPIPALASTIFLTSSRGGVLVAALAVGTFLVLAENRRRAALVIAVMVAASAAAIAVLFAHPVLIDGPFNTSSAESAGRVAAVLIVACCAGAALLPVVLEPVSPRLTRAVRVGIVVVAAAMAIAVFVATDPVKRIADASSGSDDWSSIRGHFINLSDSKRRQLWASAFDQFTGHPVVGQGSGSFEAWWSEHRRVPTFVRDAHSLYLETLGELGLVGFSLLAAVTLAGLAVGVIRIRRADTHERTLIAALTAGFAGFTLAAAEDWMWEMTIVSVVGLALLAILAAGSVRRPLPGARPIPLWARAIVAALATVVIVSEGLALLSSTSLAASRRAAARGDMAQALETADRASALQPWAASPHLQLALVLEETGNLDAARVEMGRALARDGRDWRLWLVASRIETAQGDITEARAALAQVRRLNPLLPLFTKS